MSSESHNKRPLRPLKSVAGRVEKRALKGRVLAS